MLYTYVWQEKYKKKRYNNEQFIGKLQMHKLDAKLAL